MKLSHHLVVILVEMEDNDSKWYCVGFGIRKNPNFEKGEQAKTRSPIVTTLIIITKSKKEQADERRLGARYAKTDR